MPRGFSLPTPDQPGNVLDARGASDPAAILRAALDYGAPPLEPFSIGEAVLLHQATRAALERGVFAEARAAATRLVEVAPQIPDGRYDLALADLHEHGESTGYGAFAEVVRAFPDLPEGHALAALPRKASCRLRQARRVRVPRGFRLRYPMRRRLSGRGQTRCWQIALGASIRRPEPPRPPAPIVRSGARPKQGAVSAFRIL